MWLISGGFHIPSVYSLHILHHVCNRENTLKHGAYDHIEAMGSTEWLISHVMSLIIDGYMVMCGVAADHRIVVSTVAASLHSKYRSTPPTPFDSALKTGLVTMFMGL